MVVQLIHYRTLFALQGKVFSSIQPQTNINDVCMYPNSGELSGKRTFSFGNYIWHLLATMRNKQKKKQQFC